MEGSDGTTDGSVNIFLRYLRQKAVVLRAEFAENI
jgi:hypothetical protein